MAYQPSLASLISLILVEERIFNVVKDTGKGKKQFKKQTPSSTLLCLNYDCHVDDNFLSRREKSIFAFIVWSLRPAV